MDSTRDDPHRDPRPRPRPRAGGHAPGPGGAPLCGAQPKELRFSDPPTCSQCTSVLSLQAGRVPKKKNRVKGKHAKGPEGKPLCGVEAKKAHYAKTPTCTNCLAQLAASAAAAPEKRSGKPPAKEAKKEAKKASWVIATCPVCGASIPEHRLDRHMRKIHSQKGRQPS